MVKFLIPLQKYMLTNRGRPTIGSDWFYVYYTKSSWISFWVDKKLEVRFSGRYVCFHEVEPCQSSPTSAICKGGIVVILVLTQNSDCVNRGHVVEWQGVCYSCQLMACPSENLRTYSQPLHFPLIMQYGSVIHVFIQAGVFSIIFVHYKNSEQKMYKKARKIIYHFTIWR